MPRRSIVYIDGFNLYYGAIRRGPNKWLNIAELFGVLRREERLVRVYYFTAMVTGETLPNQVEYLRALATTPLVEVVLGKIRMKDVECCVGACSHSGRRRFSVPAEKRTDVQIALQILSDAHHDCCDTLIVVSGDSDLVPAINRVRWEYPNKQVVVYVPNRDPDRGAAVEIRSAANKARDLPLNLLRRCQFPERFQDGAGGWIEKPQKWRAESRPDSAM